MKVTQHVTTADLNLLAQQPVIEFDAAALRNAGDFFGHTNRLFAPAMLRLQLPSWAEGRAALDQFFDLRKEGHCFSSEPHGWASFHEPQITGGFYHFLNEGSPARRSARCIAFARAAYRCCGWRPEAFDALQAGSATARREVSVGGEGNGRKRADIAIALRSESGRTFGLILEAKFGSDIGAGQLPGYLRYAEDHGWEREDSAFLVVAPRYRARNQQIMKDNPDWSATTWWQLLYHLEEDVRVEEDCEEYRRFRRTVWRRALQS